MKYAGDRSTLPGDALDLRICSLSLFQLLSCVEMCVQGWSYHRDVKGQRQSTPHVEGYSGKTKRSFSWDFSGSASEEEQLI